MPAPRKDYRQAVDMYEKGLSIGQVADYFEVTRQAMHKILRRRGVVFRPNVRGGEENHFYRGGKTKDERATQVFMLAVEKGILTRPATCEKCKSEGQIEGHHDSYDKPLDVRWLCHKCHYDWHVGNVADQARHLIPKMSRRDVASMGGSASWAKLTEEERKSKMAAVRSGRTR